MKRLALVLVVSTEIAHACPPLARCSDHCTNADAIVEATITAIDPDAPAVALDVTRVFGEGISPGPVTLPLAFAAVLDDTVAGDAVVLEVGAFGGDALRVVDRIAIETLEPCFSDITVEDYAATVLDPACRERPELDKLAGSYQECEDGCSASRGGGAASFALLALVLGSLIVPARRRAR